MLSTTLNRRYVGLPGWLPEGPFGPALFYAPDMLVLDYWGNAHNTVPLDKRNLGQFHVFGQHGSSFQTLVQHWPYWVMLAR